MTTRPCEWLGLAVLAAVALAPRSLAAAGASGGEPAELNWIWHPEAPRASASAPVGTRAFRKAFDLPPRAKVQRATFTVAADNRCAVWVNGVSCGQTEGWRAAAKLDVTGALRPGRNAIAVQAENVGDKPNPAGLLGELTVTLAGKAVPLVVPVDATWKAHARPPDGWKSPAFDDSAWAAARVVAPLGAAPWGKVGGFPRRVPRDFPRFVVPGREREMDGLRQLFHLHYAGAGPKATLWDGWLAKASLWPATSSRAALRAAWRGALLGRKIDAEGYVSTHQHRGLAHNNGWPFPLWTQIGGKGWHFATVGQPFGVPRSTAPDGWTLDGCRDLGVDPKRGWRVEIQADDATLTTPPMKVDSIVAPFIRLGYEAAGLPAAAALSVEWASAKQTRFDARRSVPFATFRRTDRLAFAHAAMYRHPRWGGTLTRVRLRLRGAAGATLTVQSLITAADTRHNINNTVYLQGCDDYLNWTGDLDFLRRNIGRMRRALRFAMTEFATRERKCVFTPWVGHDGRSGLEIRPGGRKVVHRGRGIGNNYWDLLPFGGKDCLATIYYHDAVRRMAAVERQVAAHPEWKVPRADEPFDPADLSRHAAEVKAHAGKLFWNATTGRFVAAVDADGKAWDYGYTFVNCEAIYYGFATPEQARSIVDWLRGRRLVAGDTSRGRDIYHWRFGPRATTRRNVEYYICAWTAPESLPWGGQVQDGGAVLGFAYYDLMSRIATTGPDDAWRRLRETLAWFAEVEAAGGYRAYYRVPGRGSLQGGGRPGGLGMDEEFFESVLLPQVMLYGFLGFRPRLDGFALAPRLPEGWPSLTVTRIAWHGQVFTIKAVGTGLHVTCDAGRPTEGKLLYPPPGRWRVRRREAQGKIFGEVTTVNVGRSGRDGLRLRLQPGSALDLTRLAPPRRAGGAVEGPGR